MSADQQGGISMPRKKGQRPYFNRPPQGLKGDIPPDAALAEFASKLQELMLKKNWNQSDLARAAAKFMPDKKFNRDNISQYIRGLTFPYPLRLAALARALGVDPQELRPRGTVVPGAGDRTPPLDVRALGDGKVWLRVNQAVDLQTAMKVLSILGQTDAFDKSK
jgi:transcriptional regulator with XRE-family HTH domain